jgi:hypothetical protein
MNSTFCTTVLAGKYFRNISIVKCTAQGGVIYGSRSRTDSALVETNLVSANCHRSGIYGESLLKKSVSRHDLYPCQRPAGYIGHGSRSPRLASRGLTTGVVVAECEIVDSAEGGPAAAWQLVLLRNR